MHLPINDLTFKGKPFSEFDAKAIERRERLFAKIAITKKIWS